MMLRGAFIDAADAVASIGNLVALVRGALSQDWSGEVAFTSRAKELHSAMLAIQCMLGGAKAPLQDLFGHTICPGGTSPACTVPEPMLREWRTLRDGFSEFWRASADRGDFSNAEAQRLKDYATAFHAFYVRTSQLCASQGVTLPVPQDAATKRSFPAWLGWTLAGVVLAGGVYVVARKR